MPVQQTLGRDTLNVCLFLVVSGSIIGNTADDYTNTVSNNELLLKHKYCFREVAFSGKSLEQLYFEVQYGGASCNLQDQ